MRLFFEFTAVALLLFLGWEKPFKQWVSTPPRSVVSPTARPANTASPAKVLKSGAAPRPVASGGWMWDKRRSTALDRGPYQDGDKAARARDANTRGFPTDGIDQNGRRYWVDPYGVRHYY